MYDPIFIRFLHSLKESQGCARKRCTAPLVGKPAPIFLTVANVEKYGARDPAGWSAASVICVAQENRSSCFYLEVCHRFFATTIRCTSDIFFFSLSKRYLFHVLNALNAKVDSI